MADEMDFLELVIANERVAQWMDVLHLGTDKVKCKAAILELSKEVSSKQSYAEEARNAKAPTVVTALLKLFMDDDEASGAISAVISACAGIGAATARKQEYQIEGQVVCIHEGLLGDGVGTRVWAVATTLCSELSTYPELVHDQEVLEIGSGCGLTGIFAAKLGARRVTLTDFLPKVLDNMVNCMHANGSAPPPDDGDGRMMDANFDPEDELDAEFEVDNMRARFLDWAEGTQYADGSVTRDSILGEHLMTEDDGMDSVPPPLEPEEKFPIIIGTDVMYEPLHAELVANVVARRLAPGGRCVLCCGVRIQAVFDGFFKHVEDKGLRLWKEPVHPRPRNGEVMGRESEYEGGFLLMCIDWEAAPAAWHRSDVFSVEGTR